MSKYSETNFFKSFAYARRGLKLAIKSQRNFSRQICVAAIAIISAILLKFSVVEFCITIILIGFVLFAELFNSVTEFLFDAVFKNRYSKLAEMAKDMAAGAVCITSFTAVTAGSVLFISKIIKFFGA